MRKNVIIVGMCSSKMKQRYPNGLPRKNSTIYHLEKWLEEWELRACSFVNLSGNPDWDGKIPEAAYIELIKDYDRVIALGALVAKHLNKAGVEHLRLPHPSGQNLQMNDKKWVAEQVKTAREYIFAENENDNKRK